MIQKTYWCQIRGFYAHNGNPFCYLWGFYEESMEKALDFVFPYEKWKLRIKEISESHWTIHHPAQAIKYILQQTDIQPEVPDRAIVSWGYNNETEKDMTIYKNFWVVRRSQQLADGTWTLFAWGFPEINMLNALVHVAKKDPTELFVKEESDRHWYVTDPVSGARYEVLMQDERPTDLPPDGPNVTTRDQTQHDNPQRKRMPVPGSLFS